MLNGMEFQTVGAAYLKALITTDSRAGERDM